MRYRPVLTALLAAALASACGGGLRSGSPAAEIYQLRAAQPAAQPQSRQLGAVQIASPTPYPGLESERIVLVHPDRRLGYFASSRWAQPLPEVVEALALEVVRGTGAFRAVHDSSSPFAADYVLRLTIRNFEASYEAGEIPQVHVSFAATLARRADREVIASFVTEASERAAANRRSAVVAAFEQAANEALSTVAARAVEAIRTSTAPSPP